MSTLHYKQTAFPYEPTVGLVFEEEYANLLASRGREGSTLDAKMRAAFDGGPLSNRKAKDTQVVTPPYWLPALIAITPRGAAPAPRARGPALGLGQPLAVPAGRAP